MTTEQDKEKLDQVKRSAAECKLARHLDWDCIREVEAEADPSVTLEDVRRILAKIPGSLADAVIEEREERF